MRHREINLTPKAILLVRGPASVVCEGMIFVLGMDTHQKEVNVRAGKVLPFEARVASRARVRLGKSANYRVVKAGKVGVSIWKSLASTIPRYRPNCIMLVGATDTGKSTLATYLSNIATANGFKVSIVDGDVGQGDLAPPGCIGAVKIVGQFSDLRNVNVEYYSFIGATSPRGVEALIIKSMKDIKDKLSARSDICIVNTDGYMDEYGIDYKIELAKALKPDLIVYLGNSAKAGRLLDEFKDKVVHANAPERMSKTHGEREKRRMDQYRRFLEGGNKITFGIGSKRFDVMSKLYNMISVNGVIHIGSAKFQPRFLHGMFVGLSGSNNVLGFGIIVKVVRGMMTLNARYEGNFDTVLLSTVRLTHCMRDEYRIPLAVNTNQGPE